MLSKSRRKFLQQSTYGAAVAATWSSSRAAVRAAGQTSGSKSESLVPAGWAHGMRANSPNARTFACRMFAIPMHDGLRGCGRYRFEGDRTESDRGQRSAARPGRQGYRRRLDRNTRPLAWSGDRLGL